MRILLTIVVLLLTSVAPPGQAEDRNFERKVPAAANGSVEISNVEGRLDIVGWDRAEVEVKGTLEEGIERVDVVSKGNRTSIKVVTRKNANEGYAELKVSVPKGSEVIATVVSADIDSTGIRGAQRLSAVSGDLRAKFSGANIQAKTVSGDIWLSGTRQPADVRASTVSGDVKLDRGAGEVEATSVSGDVNLEVNPARSVRLHSSSGDLGFRGQLAAAGMLEAETMSGEVSLTAAGLNGYEYEVMAFSGEIENCFGTKVERSEPDGPGSRLNGAIGDGGGRVRAKSMNGDIYICDK